LTSLNVSYNELTADDGARICGAAAAAGLTNLLNLDLRTPENLLLKNEGDDILSASSIVLCETWKQLELPLPPDEIVRRCVDDCAPLVSYLMSEDKVAIHSIRIFVVGESTVICPHRLPRPFYCSFLSSFLFIHTVFFPALNLIIFMHGDVTFCFRRAKLPLFERSCPHHPDVPL
jgi:hypothetical protein